MRLLFATAMSAVTLLVGGCTAGTAHTGSTADTGSTAHTGSTVHAAASPAPLPPDPRTAAALLKIAAAFNHDYDTGNYAPVYARWDARSQAIITQAGYIQRHKDCPGGSSQALSRTETASPDGSDGAWLVRYEIGGQQLTDYWFYVDHRWVFDLVLSNPAAVKLYRMSPSQYIAAAGCKH